MITRTFVLNDVYDGRRRHLKYCGVKMMRDGWPGDEEKKGDKSDRYIRLRIPRVW